MLPGSKYAMLIKKPGPVKAHSVRKLNELYNMKMTIIFSRYYISSRTVLLCPTQVYWLTHQRNKFD